MRRPLLLLLSLSPWAALAQAVTPVPQSHIPAPVLMELRSLEAQFDAALARDCAPERCFSKGCVYRDHATVDMPRNGSLPGLGATEGPGSVPPQDYLTSARCEFTHEKAVPQKDVQALVKRLEQRLSKGWLQVTVDHEVLEPISPSLRESPPAPPEPQPPPAPEVKPAAPAAWDGKVAVRELWVSLLPHFSWMIAVFLATLAALVIIWALRRLGRESLQEKAMLAQLSAQPPAPEKSAEPEAAPAAETAGPEMQDASAEEKAFVNAQRQLWTDRIAQTELGNDESALAELLRDWLERGELALLAKAIFTFGDRLSLALSSDGELASRKVELGEYLRRVDPSQLPSDAEFFQTLHQHSVSSSVLAQADAEIYRSLREEFGASGVARLVESLPGRFGPLLFALAPADCQDEVARLATSEQRLSLAEQLMVSNRISREELSYLFSVLKAARAGQPLPPAPASTGILDRGRQFDAAGALSVLFQHIEAAERQKLFAGMLQKSAGALPRWYEDILYPDMLLKLPAELQADLLLDVDIRGLAGWSSVQPPQWREGFINRMAPAMQNAVRASMAFSSRADQLRLAKAGHDELVSAVKKQVARGKVSFAEILG